MEALTSALTVAGAAAGLAWFIGDQFARTRHLIVNKLTHRDQRILRLELWLAEHYGFDLGSELPKIGNGASDG